MKIRNLLAACLLSVSMSAQAVIIDSFDLNMNGSAGQTGVNSTAVLALGVDYIVRISGTFEIGCIGGGNPCPTDAEYYVPSAGAGAGTAFTAAGFNTGTDIGAQINNVKIDWGAFNPARTYSTIFTGLGSTIFVNYLDTNYGDNSGSLAVTIETLDALPAPEPASLALMLAGLTAAPLARRRRTERI